jgi:Lipopolysaccharide kinase (Kdo/WaaP) family
VRFGDVPDDLERALPRFLDGRPGEGAETLKAGRVHRLGAWVVKVAGPSSGRLARLRRSPLRRELDLALRLRAVRTPRPLCLVEERHGLAVERGLLVTEFVAGRHLPELWGDARAVAAFPAFLARMHAARVYHGDLHPLNSIWDGTEWVLIDLASLRRGLHKLLGRRLVERQWMRLVHNLTYGDPDAFGRVRELFARYRELSGAAGDVEPAWERVCAGARRLRRAAGLAEPIGAGP